MWRWRRRGRRVVKWRLKMKGIRVTEPRRDRRGGGCCDGENTSAVCSFLYKSTHPRKYDIGFLQLSWFKMILSQYWMIKRCLNRIFTEDWSATSSSMALELASKSCLCLHWIFDLLVGTVVIFLSQNSHDIYLLFLLKNVSWMFLLFLRTIEEATMSNIHCRQKKNQT